jgi:outer membrane protein assembly factor BamE (lipoprotein component of BamABCDE complex)
MENVMLRQTFITLTLLLCLSSCSLIYKAPINQGVQISSSSITKGETKQAVINKLGTPLIQTDSPNQLIYAHSQRVGHHPTEGATVTITFDQQNKVATVETHRFKSTNENKTPVFSATKI